MPTVPQYQNQVSPNLIPSARVNVNPVGIESAAAVGKGLQNVAGVLADIGAAERKKARESRMLSNISTLQNADFELFNGPNGAFNTKGKDSFGLNEVVLPEFDKRVSEIEKTISDPEEKLNFRSYADNLRNQRRNGLAAHISKESESYYAGQSKAAVDGFAQTAANNYTSPDMVEDQAVLAEAAAVLPMTGQSPEALAAARAQARGTVYGTVIQQMAKDSPEQAMAFFEKVKPVLPADLQDSIADGLEPAVRQERGVKLGGDIWASSKGNKAAIASALADIEDQRVRRIAKSEIATLQAERDAERAAAVDGLKKQAWTQAVSGVPLSRMDPTLVARLVKYEPKTFKEIQDWQERGGKVTTDLGAYSELASMSDAELAKVNLDDYRSRLSDTDYKRFADRKGEAARGGPSKAGFTREQLNDQISASLPRALFPAAGYDRNNKIQLSGPQRETLGRVQQQVDREIEAAQASGQKLTWEARQAIIDRAAMAEYMKTTTVDVDYGVMSMGGDKPLDKITMADVEDGGARIPAGNVPPKQLELAKEQLRRLGLNEEKVTDENAATYFTAFVAAGGGGNGRKMADAFMAKKLKGQ